jgi:HD-GYP domain-containing protein (c-di-GMP phosphodiesterase class II)
MMANGDSVNLEIIVQKEHVSRDIARNTIKTLEDYEEKEVEMTIKSENHNYHIHEEIMETYAVLTCHELNRLHNKDYHIKRDNQYLVGYAARWHDIGKLDERIPQYIWNKSGKPTAEEWRQIRKHPEYSEEKIIPLKNIAEIAKYHHERYDGTGYPEGKRGEEIPLGARIISVIDAFSAMTHDRGYNHDRVLDAVQAAVELRRCAGTQFDPIIVEAFIRVLKSLGKIPENFKDI